MKIYEKPMAIIEKINVEDVITASGEMLSNSKLNSAGAALDKTGDATIVFEW